MHPKQEEKVSMVRSIFIGAASFAFTAVMIVGTSVQGSALLG
jgi:hypothetical protein